MRSSLPHIIELDGSLYTFRHDRIDPVTDIREVRGNRCQVSDLESAISRVMTVEADAKYAEVLVNKKLQEMGEFDEPLTVISHWKRQKSKNATEIFFTALPSRLYHQYRDMMAEDDAHFILYPLYAVLFWQLKQIRSNRPVAVVFQHGRFADMVVGTAKRVYYANRFVAFDTSEDQIASLWATLRRDVESVAEENRFDLKQIYLLTWLDTIPPPEWPEDAGAKLYYIKKQTVIVEGQAHEISFPNVLGKLPATLSIAPGQAKFLFQARRAAPLLNGAMALMLPLLLAAMWWLHNRAGQFEADAAGLRGELARTRIVQTAAYAPEELEQAMTFLKSLDYNRKAPAFRKVLSAFSPGNRMEMILESIKMTYTEGAVQIEAYGHIPESFDDAHRGYQLMLAHLRNSGYRIDEEHFDTKINNSSFLLKVSRRIQ